MIKWTLHMDGASNVKGIGLGITLRSNRGDIKIQSICCSFRATNNKVKYEALITRLQLAKGLKIGNLEIKNDSQLVTKQMDGTYEA